ncbi:hypothetical protein ACHQM5_013191 [Ranunculus cassubicifolius]
MKTLPQFAPTIHCLLLLSIFLHTNSHQVIAITQELLKGFSATPQHSISSFQSLLTDPTSNFSFGFLRVNQSSLTLAILHLPSSEPIWIANTSNSVSWSKHTQLSFNGDLILSDTRTQNLFWSTRSNGDSLILLNNSNLQVLDESQSVVWQSFDFPSDTFMSQQNFTAKMSLISSNGLYSMRLGDDYIGLYELDSKQIYWKHKAMQAKAQIVEGNGPIHLQISSDGYLGAYQTETAPVDVVPFDTFQSKSPGIRRLKLESNGNLKGYYWNGSDWSTDYTAITKECELPNSCGFYGLCQPGKPCECIDNKTEHHSGECSPPVTGNFCSGKPDFRNGFSVVRRNGVELVHKEWMEFEQMGSLQECQGSCEKNCSCWGTVYNNASGYCYMIDYPIHTLLGVGDERKMGYFKVRKVAKKKRNVGYAIGIGVLVSVFVVFVAMAAYGAYRIWKRNNGVNKLMEEGVSPGSYRGLSSESFRSVELTKG